MFPNMHANTKCLCVYYLKHRFATKLFRFRYLRYLLLRPPKIVRQFLCEIKWNQFKRIYIWKQRKKNICSIECNNRQYSISLETKSEILSLVDRETQRTTKEETKKTMWKTTFNALIWVFYTETHTQHELEAQTPHHRFFFSTMMMK